jgi:hypothetical protein
LRVDEREEIGNRRRRRGRKGLVAMEADGVMDGWIIQLQSPLRREKSTQGGSALVHAGLVLSSSTEFEIGSRADFCRAMIPTQDFFSK